MNKFVTLTAALATMTAFSVHAQEGTNSSTSTDGITTDPTELADPALNSPAQAGDTPMVDSTTTAAPMASATDGYTMYSGTPVLATDLQNANIYTESGQVVGGVTQVMASDDGSANQLIFDVGQYMGADSKVVAVPVTDVQVYTSADGSEYRIILPMTEAQIQGLPEYAN